MVRKTTSFPMVRQEQNYAGGHGDFGEWCERSAQKENFQGRDGVGLGIWTPNRALTCYLFLSMMIVIIYHLSIYLPGFHLYTCLLVYLSVFCRYPGNKPHLCIYHTWMSWVEKSRRVACRRALGN